MSDQVLTPGGQLESHLEFETLIADLSSRLINLPSNDVNQEIDVALERVCAFLEIDLAILWQWSGMNPDLIEPTHVFAREGLRPSEPMREDHYPWCRQQVLAGRMVAFSSLEDLPAEAAVDRESCRLFGVKSSLCLPLVIGGERLVGALGLNSLRTERDWPDALVKRLQLVAQILTNALARIRHELTLRENEERLSLAADSAGAGLWTLDFETRAFWATQRARLIFGVAVDDPFDLDQLAQRVHPDDVALFRETIERSRCQPDPVEIEYRLVEPGGTVRWIAFRGRTQFHVSGKAERLMGSSIDVTERKWTEEAFRRSEARLAVGTDLGGLAFYEVDFQERVAYTDDRFRRLCGLPPDLQQGIQPLHFWMEHLHPDDRQRVLAERERLHSGKVDPLTIEYRYLHPTDSEKWLHHVGSVLKRKPSGDVLLTFGVLRDTTEIRRTEEALRELSRRLIGAHEEERALLARELHDDVTQRLAVLAIDVGRAEMITPRGPHVEAMRAVREGLVRLSEDIHTLAYQLHPSVLEELGLSEALRTECERLRRRSAVALSADLEPVPAGIGKEAALCLFRIAQEALNNMTRHANARTARITLRQMDGGLLLSVRDDGAGFDPESPGKAKSLGLASMRERVRLVNGTLDIESAPGHGTTIVAWAPGEGAEE